MPGIGMRHPCVGHRRNVGGSRGLRVRTATRSARTARRRRGTTSPSRVVASTRRPGVLQRRSRAAASASSTPPESRRCCPPRHAGTFRCRDRRCGRPAPRRRRPSRRRSGSASRRYRVRRSPTATATRRGPSASTSASVDLGHRAHRDQPDRSHGVRQRFCRPIGDQLHRAPPSSAPNRVERRLRWRTPRPPDRAATRPRRGWALRRENVRRGGGRRGGAALTAADHAGRTFGERQAACRIQAASPDGALTSSGRAALATSTSAVNAAGSLTAISARFLRSTSTPAALRPWISRL